MNFLFNNRPFSIASKLLIGCFVVLAYGLIQGHSALAATSCTFASVGTSAWSTAANWTCNDASHNVPTSTVNAIIPVATSTSLSVDSSAKSVTIGAGSTLTFNSHNLDVAGDWADSGTIVPGTGIVSFSGGIAQNIAAEANFYDLIINKSGNTATLTGNVTSTHDFILTLGTFALSDKRLSIGRNYSNVGGTLSGDTGTVEFDGAGAQGITAEPNFNNILIRSAGTVTLTGDIFAFGTLVTKGGAGTLDAEAFNLRIAGASTIGTGTTVTSTSGAMRFEFSVTNAGRIGSISGDKQFDAVINNTGGVLDVGSGYTTTTNFSAVGTVNGNSGTLVIGTGGWAVGGTFNRGTGTVKYGGSTNTVRGSYAYNNLIIDENDGSTATADADVTVHGTYRVAAGSSFDLTTHNLSVTLSTLNLGTTTSTSGTLTFTGAVTNSGSIGSVDGNKMFGSTLANSGVLNIGSGVATSTGSLDNSGGTINGDTGRLEIVADYVSPAPGTFNAGTGTVRIYGTANQSIRGETFYTLEVMKTAGTAILTSNATLNSALNTYGSGGTFSADTYTLDIGGGSGISAGSVVTSTTGTIIFRGPLSNDGSLGSSHGNLDFASGMIVSNAGTIDVGTGVATSTTGTFNGAGIINCNSGTLVIRGTWSNGATFNRGTGTVVYEKGGFPPLNQTLRGGYTYNNLVVKTTGTITVDADVTVMGTLSVPSGINFDLATRNLSVTGATTNAGTTTSTTGVLTFNGAVTNSGSIGSDSGSKLFGSTLANSGTLDIGAGIATTTGSVTGAGTINGNTGTLIILSDFTAGTFNSGVGTATVKFNGTANQSIKGLAFNDVIVEKTAGTVTFITTDAFIGGTLGVWAGTLSAGSVNLTVLDNTTIVPGGMVTSTTGNLDFFSAVGNSGNVGSSSGDIFFEGAFLNSGNLDVGSGNVTTTDAVTGAGVINGNTGTLVASSTLAFTTFNAGTGMLRLYGNEAQDITGATFYNLDVKKSANTATIITNNATVGGTLTSEGAGTLDLQTRTLTVTGISTIGSNTTVTSTTGTLTFNSAVTNAGSIGSVSGDKLFISTLANSGTLVIGSGTATSTGSLTNTGAIKGNTGKLALVADYSGAGTFTANAGTVRLYGTADQSIRGVAFYNLDVRKASHTATIATANATVGGALTVSGAAGILTASSRNLTVSGASTIGTGSTVTSTSGTLAFAAVTNAGSLGSSSGPITMTSLANTGTVGLGAESTSTAAITSSGTIRLNGETLNVGGNWTDTGTLTPIGGGVKFNGGGAQSIGTEANFYNFGVNKLAGIATLAGHVSTTNFLLISGTLAVADKIFYAPGNYANTGLVTRTTGKIKHSSDYENFVNSSGVTQTSYTTPGVIYFEVKDLNRNMNGAAADTIALPVAVDAGAGGDTETITLTETGLATGIFRSGAIGFYTGILATPGNNEIVITHTGIGTETYTDNQDAADTGATTATLTYAGVVNPPGGGGGGGGGGLPPVVTHYESGTSGADRTANLANLSSMGLPIHSLVKLADDGNGATQEDSAVYYVGNDGKRHAFPNSKIYFTWYSNFDKVTVITAGQLASIPLGTNVRYKPGSRMVKFTTDLKVYAVDAKGTLRWVKTEDLAKALYGNDWNTKIDDLSDAFFGNYSFGADVNSAADFDVNKVMASELNISEDF